MNPQGESSSSNRGLAPSGTYVCHGCVTFFAVKDSITIIMRLEPVEKHLHFDWLPEDGHILIGH